MERGCKVMFALSVIFLHTSFVLVKSASILSAAEEVTLGSELDALYDCVDVTACSWHVIKYSINSIMPQCAAVVVIYY